jgi:hypothetical protein
MCSAALRVEPIDPFSAELHHLEALRSRVPVLAID